MKREYLLAIVSTIVLLLMVTTCVYAVDVADIILEDDFEGGQEGWAQAARGVAAMVFTIDNKESISGDQSARFEVGNIGGGGMHDLTLDSVLPIELQGDETYTVDFWVKAEEDRTIAIDLLMNHDPWSNVFRIENIPVTTEWEVQHHTFKATLDDPNTVFLFSFSRASNKNPTATMWIDRVRFYRGDFEEEDLVGKPPQAVTPDGKLAGSWGLVKSGNSY
ncbi:carbohydrate binding domain-containing protein [Candidatus Poribacteria bacterium]